MNTRNAGKGTMTCHRTITTLFAFLMTAGMADSLHAADGTANATSSDGTATVDDFRYQANWDSIRSHYECPAWFRDAKFGIFLHWGPYTVPAYGTTKYAKYMYYKDWERNGKSAYKHHLETYGKHSEFGYKDFVPMFTAEKFDAESWIALFKEAGARYVVPVAEHHDAFAMYNSKHTRWNVVNMGPKKDTMRMLADATRAAGLKFGASSHFATARGFYSKKDPTFDTNNPEFQDLYMKPKNGKDELPSQEFLDLWWNRTTDIIDQYEPDLLWFDFGIDKPGYKELHPKILAYYYNKGLEWNKEVVFQDKNMKNESFPEDLIVLDIERGVMDDIRELPWQTDTATAKNAWSYIEGVEFKTSNSLLHDLVDIVSKNGCLLLNVGPKSDGTITDEETAILREMGEWLKLNGEAIYSTRPWKIYGEGPTKVVAGHYAESEKSYVAADIRFTTKGETLYATSLGWPEDGAFTIKSLAKGNPHESRAIQSVGFVSGNTTLRWMQTDEGLVVQTNGNEPCEAAYVFRIRFK